MESNLANLAQKTGSKQDSIDKLECFQTQMKYQYKISTFFVQSKFNSILRKLCFKPQLRLSLAQLSPSLFHQIFWLVLPCIARGDDIIAKLSPSPNPNQLGAELVIFPNNPATHPPTRHTRKVVSRPRMTVTSKAKLLVSTARPQKYFQTLTLLVSGAI